MGISSVNMLVNTWLSWKKNLKTHSNVSSHNLSRTVLLPTTLRRCTLKHTLLSVLIPLLKLKKQRRSPKRDGQKPRCPRPKKTTVFVRRRSAIFVLLQEKKFFFSLFISPTKYLFHIS